MSNPYLIKEQAIISFSGGRTSAFMLWKILEAHGGTLPDNLKVVFANTGKEMPETLDFVQACTDHWGVPITWVELSEMHREEGDRYFTKGFRIVDYASASRKGEPFDIALKAVRSIPNARNRYCTGELKIRPMTQYAKSIGFETPFLTVVGIRGDEQRRAVKIHGVVSEGQEKYCPLWIDGITAEDVGRFWDANNFDLQLPGVNGVTDWGNCDLCFLKAKNKRISLIRQRPDLADWWIQKEKEKGQLFRVNFISYEEMKLIATDHGDLFADGSDEESIPCFCGD